MKIFNNGDYIVLLSTCNGDKNVWYPRIQVGYCYKLVSDAYNDKCGFYIEKDNTGERNGWSCCDSTYISNVRMRLAFPNEVSRYNKFGRPFKVNLSDERKYKLERLKVLSNLCE